MKKFTILSATAILGYGFPTSSFEEGLKRNPDLIAADAGSTDPGPYYLGAGYSFTDKNAVKRDLEIMICAGLKNNIPVVIGTCGGSGAQAHLDEVTEIVKEISKENSLTFKLALISADADKKYVTKKLKEGKVASMLRVPELKQKDIDESVRIVGQMGIEPFIKALDSGAQVVLAGRAYDPAVFAALAVKNGFNKAYAIHMGKILECAAIACTPGSGSDCMLGTIYEDGFIVEPLNPIRKATVLSVSAHTLYEKTDPYILPGPGGHLDLTECKFDQISENSVKVSGTKFIESSKYTIKLEGVRHVGFRTVSICGVRDPIFISQVSSILDGVKERVKDNFSKQKLNYFLNFKVYGINGVMGKLEPIKNPKPHELGIIIDVVAPTQEIANTICGFTRSTLLHYGYPDRIATAGNLALPYSPSDFKAGDVFEFSIYHIIETDDPCEMFPIKYHTMKNGKLAK